MEKFFFAVDEVKKKLEQYCVYQDRCHQEVEKKLKEFKLIAIAREEVLLHLIQHDFLNEERFAKSFARGKFRIKKYGKLRIVKELKYRNLSEYNIKIALKEIDEQEYTITIHKLIEKKAAMLSEQNLIKKKKKILDYMLRKGYEYELIIEAIALLYSS
ncbi:MAG: recombinase RecX [Flavobacteriaceae bacterium]|nr:MAG: recombinase RecX [Flavobacteriaceae bacterium]